MFYAEFEIGLSVLLKGLKGYMELFPTAPWFQPAPLLEAMIARNVTVTQLQRDPELVPQLMAGKTMNAGARSKL